MEQEELAAIDHELSQIEIKIDKLSQRKEFLLSRQHALKDKLMLKKSEALSTRDWEKNDFPWSADVQKVLEEKFKIKVFRPYQLPTINALLSKEDTILIMPTGGGKSLCYQIPALVSKGFGLVVSPLVSLMEDQTMALEKINIPAYMLSANTPKDVNQKILTAMTDKKSPMKILYVTPERMAKSKRFMNKLQTAFQQDLLSLIAIDEVHCCSQWGHDFRPDYKFLGVLRAMFPGVPLLGVTATATSKIIVDVQKILDIRGCLVLKASFNRPNLYYEVREKPADQDAIIDELSDLLTHRFRGKSGIIYTTLIKDAEEVYRKLRERKIAAAYYHANMEAANRTEAHQLWAKGKLQVIVATLAFGMGIDKPDVRFVIHHSIPKSMESFYQESGRAGRDGEPSDCILFFRMADVFKVSTMVFTSQTGLENLYNVVKYCLDSSRCRRQQIAHYFDEAWESTDCNAMCDNCRNPRTSYDMDIGKHCKVIYDLISHAANQDSKLTCQKLLDMWFNKGSVKSRLPNHKPPSIPRVKAEAIIGHLLSSRYIQEDFHFTAYSTISYLKRGKLANVASNPKHTIMVQFAGGPASNNSSQPKTTSDKEEKMESKKRTRESKPTGSSSRSATSVVDLSSDSDEEFVSPQKKKNNLCVLSDSE